MNRTVLLVAAIFAAAGILLAQTRVGAGDFAGSVTDQRAP